jgi:hypothetical protein
VARREAKYEGALNLSVSHEETFLTKAYLVIGGY